MLPFSKKIFILRVIFFSLLSYATFFSSFWEFIFLGVFAVVIFPVYLELVFFLYIRESLFIFDKESFFFLGGTLILIGFVYWLRTQIRL